MATSLFKLCGSIFVDNEKANESIAKTDKKAQGLGEKFTSGVKTAAKWGAGIATAAGVGVTALTGLASSVADTAGAIDDASKKTGMSVENYQQWAYAAKLGGMEASKLDSIMIKQQKSFADAKTGSESMAEAYQKLGVDLASISDSEDAFEQVMESLADMEDETERNAIANDIFGKSYADLAPLLEEGSDGIKRLKQEAVEMGGVLSQDAVQAGASFGDTIDQLKTAGAGLFNSLGTAVIPVVQQFATLLLTNMPMIQGMIAQVAPVLSTLFTSLMPPLTELVQNIFPLLVELFNAIMPIVTDLVANIVPILVELLNMFLPPLIEIVQTLLPPLLEVVMALMPLVQLALDLLKPILDLVTSLLAPIAKLVSDAVKPLVNVLTNLIDKLLKPFIPLVKLVGEAIGKYLTSYFESVGKVVNNVKNIFSGITTFLSGVFTGNWKKAFQGLSNIVSNIFGAIVNIVKAPINAIITGVNAFIGALNKIKIPDWVPVVGGKGINIPLIPKLAKGGIVDAGQMFVANEAGPELVGSYGNKSAVMNNDQIVKSVSDGVYAAVRSAGTNEESIYKAMSRAMSEWAISVNENGIVKIIKNANRDSIIRTGKPVLGY